METTCSICMTSDLPLTLFRDHGEGHPVCHDCLAAIMARADNPARWTAFVNKYGDGLSWYELLPLPQQPLNKLRCK